MKTRTLLENGNPRVNGLGKHPLAVQTLTREAGRDYTLYYLTAVRATDEGKARSSSGKCGDIRIDIPQSPGAEQTAERLYRKGMLDPEDLGGLKLSRLKRP
jgi:hypothetical protein